MFLKSEVLSVHLALLNLTCLHDVLCGSLGVIKFAIELLIIYFFENIHLLLVLKCLVHYLQLPLINIFAYDRLYVA